MVVSYHGRPVFFCRVRSSSSCHDQISQNSFSSRLSPDFRNLDTVDGVTCSQISPLRNRDIQKLMMTCSLQQPARLGFDFKLSSGQCGCRKTQQFSTTRVLSLPSKTKFKISNDC